MKNCPKCGRELTAYAGDRLRSETSHELYWVRWLQCDTCQDETYFTVELMKQEALK
jgi:RNase P subunit RPR2